MSISTSILGPYDDLSVSGKTLVSASVPHEVKKRLFTDLLPLRGSVDKVLCRQVQMLDAWLFQHDLSSLSLEERELLVSNVLNKMTEYLSTLKLSDVK